MIEVGGLAVLKLGGVTVTVFPGDDGKDRMAIVIAPGEEIGFDVLNQDGDRFWTVDMESDTRHLRISAEIRAHDPTNQHISASTPYPENQAALVTVRGVEPRPAQPRPRVREIINARP